MKIILQILALSLLIVAKANAVSCYITMVKASCWLKYDVTVDVLDSATGEAIKTVMIYDGESWAREKFDCKPGMILALEASFRPVFWAQDEGKIYKTRRYWSLPKEISENEIGWNVTVCYPEWFAGVPLPPNATKDCKCDLSSVPKIDPRSVR